MKYLMLVPCYNVEHLLPYFFDSIERMTPKPNKIVFSIHNITDKTTEMIRDFNAINTELITLPDFPKDFAKKYGEFENMAIVRQKLWNRAREINAKWTFMIDSDMFCVTKNALDVLSNRNKDFVVTMQIHRALHYEGRQVFVSAKFLNGERPYANATVLTLKDGLVVACPTDNLQPFYSGIEWAGGFYCFSQKFVQDRRLNWHPIIEMTEQEKRLNKYYRQAAEDCSFCHKARELAYEIFLDGLVKNYHVIEDPTKPKKAWNTPNYEFPKSKTKQRVYAS